MARKPSGILTNASYRVAADVFAKAASVVLYVVMARELGTTEFGVFAFGLTFVTLVTVLADFGQTAILTREVARDHRLVDRYFANTILLKLALALPALVVSIAILSAVAEPQTRNVALLLGIAVVAEQMMSTCFATYQAFERLVYIPIALLTQRFLMTAIGCAALIAGAGVVAVSAVYLACALVGLAVALWLLYSRVVRPRPEVHPGAWGGLMRAAAPIGIAIVFSTVLFRADMAMLAVMKSAEAVGEYAAAYRLFETTLFLTWGVGSAVYPVYSRLGPGRSPEVLLVVERTLKLLVALTLPLAVGAVILADPLVDVLYGSDYDASVDALALLAPAIALYPFAYIAGLLLVSQHRQGVLAPIYALIAVENILLNLVLIPTHSLYGAAIGTSLSQILVTVPLLYYCTKAIGRLDWMRMVGGPVTASLLAGVVMAALVDNFTAALVAAPIVYVASLLVFERLVYPRDARAVLDLLPAAV